MRDESVAANPGCAPRETAMHVRIRSPAGVFVGPSEEHSRTNKGCM